MMYHQDLINFYYNARKYVMENGYKQEVEWCEHRKEFEYCDAETFYFEYVYVVLNAGMKEQIARKIYDRFCNNLDFTTIGHQGKRMAIQEGSIKYKQWFLEIKNLRTTTYQIEYLKTLPWIGDITKYHLARNIGIDCVKPDRHLVRLANKFNFDTPHQMCRNIHDVTNERLGVIDVILWRYCNLKGSI